MRLDAARAGRVHRRLTSHAGRAVALHRRPLDLTTLDSDTPRALDGRAYPEHLRAYEQFDGELLPVVAKLEPATFDDLSFEIDEPRARASLPRWLASAEWRGLVERRRSLHEWTPELRSGGRAVATARSLTARRRTTRDFLKPDSPWPAAFFSDPLVLASPVLPSGEEETAIGGLVVQAAWLRLDLIAEGFFVRGGLSVGHFHIRDGLIFGPAQPR